jgi:uncharacterized protein YukE
MFDLLRFARQIVAGVASQMTQQINMVQQQAFRPMQLVVQQVTGGIWIGKGADAFVQEVQTLVMPKTNSIIQTVTKTQRDLQHAVDVIDRADQQVRQRANALADVFKAIYR